MGYYDDLGECDSGFYRRPCVYLRDGLDDRSCVFPNCSKCVYARGRQPYCAYAYNNSCQYYNCWSCDAALDDNGIVFIHDQIKKEKVYVGD